jgi:hypothetical protein
MALLVGNARYSQGPLGNPVNDVRLIGGMLSRLGFTVTILEDADKPTFHGAVVDFCTRLEQAGAASVALFYYAGHGIQHDGTNYLLPVNANIPSSRHLAVGALRVDEIVAELARMPRKANVIVLDACRNNPLPTMAVSSRDVTQGLAALKLPAEGMLVVYSTAAGEVAEDGESDRSPYATALVEALPGLLERGRRIHDVFVEAADRVREATAGKQKPALYMHGSLPALAVAEPDDAVGKSMDKPADDRAAPVPPLFPPSEAQTRRRHWRRLLVGLSAIAVLAVVVSMTWLGGWRPFDGTVANNPAGEKRDLAYMLATEFPASQIPFGYRFHFIEPFCCSGDEKEKRLGIESYSRVYFVRDDLPQPKPKAGIPSWEGFSYIVFTDATKAARFTLADLDSLGLVKLLLGDDDVIARHFNERAWRGTVTVQVASQAASPREFPCYVADTLIGCLVRSPNPRVLYQLLLQEPQLRAARTDEVRQNLVKARVQKEVGLLMLAAEEHIKWAERQAGR